MGGDAASADNKEGETERKWELAGRREEGGILTKLKVAEGTITHSRIAFANVCLFIIHTGDEKKA